MTNFYKMNKKHITKDKKYNKKNIRNEFNFFFYYNIQLFYLQQSLILLSL